MIKPELLEKLAAYVPTPVAEAIYRQPCPLTQPISRRFPAAVLFADISGFTSLSELLNQAGPAGAEELTVIVNSFFTRMIQISQSYQGQVVKFSGDAMTVLFPAAESSLQTAVRQAGECALAMQAKMSQSAEFKTSQGPASFSMRVGVGAGDVLECSIGGALGRWEYVVGGDPLVQVAMAEHHAGPGQIVLSPQAWTEAEAFFIGVPNTDGHGFVNLYKTISPLPDLPASTLAWEMLNPEERRLAEEALRCYIPGAIKARLDQQSRWLAELRRMTILFVGIGGLDYEASLVGEQLQNLLQSVQEVIYRFEGSLGKVAVDDKGTVLLILFGAPPFSHEDDTKRAVACALGLQTVAREQNLRMSIGISEGSIFAGPVGAPNRWEYTVIGDEVNLAARLMQYGRAGTIIISERVKERAGPHFITESLGTLSLRGKARSLTAYLVKGEQGVQDEMVNRYLLHEDLLVGRKAELEQIRRMASRARAGKLQLLFIEGELGLGKSRLAAEMVREWIIEGNIGYGSKCISYGKQMPYQAWREVLVAIFGLNPTLTPKQKLARLATNLAKLPVRADQPTYWTDRLPLLADILGLEAPPNDFTRHISSELRRDNIFALIETILRNQMARHPLLILLEDVHWADELSLSLAAYLAEKLADTSLFFVLVHRPMPEKDLQALQEIKAKLNGYTLYLEPLSAQESLDLIRIVLGNKPLAAQTEDVLLRRGQGNPFFLQEIVGAVLTGINGQDKSTPELAQTLDLPDTIQDVILSRIDKLSEAEKLTLKIASVIGTSFQRLLLSKVHPMNDAQFLLASQLDKLEREKILRLEVPAPKWEYVFRNIIAQEVVYEGLLLSQRRQLHTIVGAALELLAPDEIDRLAFHYSRSDNADKAIRYLKAAGQKAQREYANQAAIGYYSRILEYLADPELGRQLISGDYWDILFERIKLYNLTGQRDREREDLETLGIMAEALNDNRRRALAAKQWVYLYETSGDHDSGLELIERAVALAQVAQDERLVGESYNQWGKLLYLRGEYQVAHDYLQNALLVAQKYKDKMAQADCLNNLSLVAHYQGDYEVAIYLFQEAIELWSTSSNQAGLARSLCNLGQVYYDMGQYTTAQQRYTQALKLNQMIGDRAGEALTQLGLGQVQRSLGNYEEAYELFDAAFRFYHAIGDRHHEAHCLLHLGLLYGRMGENETALTFLEEAITFLRDLKDPWALARALTYYGWVLHNTGRSREAKRQITEALKIEHDIHQENFLVEDTALLGRIALTRNDLSLAETCVQHALNFIERRGVWGIEHPAMVYLTGYQVLQRGRKFEAARKALVEGYNYVMSLASQIEDSHLRESYLNHVPEVQELCSLYRSVASFNPQE